MARSRRRVTACVLAMMALALTLGWQEPLHADPAPGDPEPGGEAAFEAGVVKVQKQLDGERFAAGLAGLQALLAEHEGATYVRARRLELEDLAERLALAAAFPPPKPADVVSGELLRYVSSSGQLTIRYTPETWDDLAVVAEQLRAFPAPFTGPFTVQVRGPEYPTSARECPHVAVGFQEHPETGLVQVWQVVCGVPYDSDASRAAMIKPRLIYHNGTRFKEIDERDKSAVRGGVSYRIKVSVTTTGIKATINGKSLVKGKKPRGMFGHAAFHAPNCTEVLLTGPVEPSWIQGRLDEVVQKNREVFEQTWAPSKVLPAWLLEEATSAGTGSPATGLRLPPGVSGADRDALRSARAHIEGGHFLSALVALATPSANRAAAPARAYLRAWANYGLGKLDDALEAARACRAEAPSFADAHVLEARILDAMGRTAEAGAILEAVLAAHETDARIYAEMALHLLRAERLDDAKTLTERALSRGLTSPRLEQIGRALVKALRGPTWSSVHEHESSNYHVVSDIDRATCRKAAKILEDAHGAYQATLPFVPRGKRRKFKVYLFGGRAGFREYMKDLEALSGETPENVAGAYNGLLKQLVIWNLPRREMMMETVRHEGFHQYLDRFVDSPPIWFNEGMAEYCERAYWVGNKLYFGKVEPKYLRMLEERPPVPLKDFLVLSPRGFYRGGVQNYAQAWAFVHMLRHGTTAQKKIFATLLENFRTMPAWEATQRAFEGTSPEQLDRALKAYLEQLAEE